MLPSVGRPPLPGNSDCIDKSQGAEAVKTYDLQSIAPRLILNVGFVTSRLPASTIWNGLFVNFELFIINIGSLLCAT